jgi:rubredoxin
MATYKTWQCGTCGFVYDEAEGLPDEGLAPGTRWADIADGWACPDCGMSKDQFDMAEI